MESTENCNPEIGEENIGYEERKKPKKKLGSLSRR